MTCAACGKEARTHARFCDQCGATLDIRPAPIGARTARRQLTVMFCDLVNSTVIGERVDAEELGDLLDTYRIACHEIIEQRHGRITRVVGDGLLVQFGYPEAREDSARLAVMAGLEIRAKIPTISSRHLQGSELAVRVGIHTGLVVIEESSAGEVGPAGLIGNTLNIAARLQTMAPAGSVVVSEDTFRLVQGHFVVESLGPCELRGLARPVESYRIVESASARSLFSVRASRGLSPLVGRRGELAELARNWEIARAGATRTLMLAGDAGIGKSRLLHEFQSTLPDSVVQITIGGNLLYLHTPFHPIAGALAPIFGITDADGAAERLTKVRAAQQRLGIEGDAFASNVASVFVDAGNTAPVAERDVATLKQRRAGVISALLTYVRTVAARAPLLLIFEDLHWTDPSTIELIATKGRTLSDLPILMIATTREDAPVDIGASATISLGRLGVEDGLELVETIGRGGAIPVAIRDEIVQRADGVPLFIEELMRWMADAFARGELLPPGSIVPPTLQDSLLARLDRLGSAKAAAQIAAAIGRNFDLALLADIWMGEAADLPQAIDRLIAAGLIMPSAPPAGIQARTAAFEFKHELLRGIAYESLLRASRRQIHGRIAASLQSNFSERARRHPELVAHHFREAGQHRAALPLLSLAGQRAIQNSANEEAAAHFTRALEAVAELPRDAERDAIELKLRLGLATALMIAKGYGAPELDETILRANKLTQSSSDAAALFQLIYGRWSYQQVTGQLARSMDLAHEAVALAGRHAQPEWRMVALRLLGTSLQVAGKPAAAADVLEQSLALFEDGRDDRLAYAFGADMKVATLCSLAWALFMMGRQTSAIAAIDAAWARAMASEHVNTRAYCGCYRLSILAMSNIADGFGELLGRCVTYAAEHHLPIWLASMQSFEGWIVLRNGDAARAATALRGCLEQMRRINLVYWRPVVCMWLGEALAASGDPAGAERAFSESLDVMERSGENWAKPELFRIWACAQRGAGQDADALFEQSFRLAEEQGSSGWSLRTLISQAGILRADLPEGDTKEAGGAGRDRALRERLRRVAAQIPRDEFIGDGAPR